MERRPSEEAESAAAKLLDSREFVSTLTGAAQHGYTWNGQTARVVAAAMEQHASARVRAAVERACGAVCEACRTGDNIVVISGQSFYHDAWCKAAAIRAAFTEER